MGWRELRFWRERVKREESELKLFIVQYLVCRVEV